MALTGRSERQRTARAARAASACEPIEIVAVEVQVRLGRVYFCVLNGAAGEWRTEG